MIEQLLDPFGIVPDRAGIAIRRVASWDDALARASNEELLLELRRRTYCLARR